MTVAPAGSFISQSAPAAVDAPAIAGCIATTMAAGTTSNAFFAMVPPMVGTPGHHVLVLAYWTVAPFECGYRELGELVARRVRRARKDHCPARRTLDRTAFASLI